jgi:uncharacterized protein (TIGR00369 family)
MTNSAALPELSEEISVHMNLAADLGCDKARAFDRSTGIAAPQHRPPYPGLRDFGAEAFTAFSRGYFPDWLGLDDLVVEPRRVHACVALRQELMAPHGYLHGGTLVSIADSLCGYGTIANLPEGASGFVTIELKSNFIGTIRQGRVQCEATPAHIGRSTQVWDAVVSDESNGHTIAVFRCSQMVLRRLP